MEHILVGYCTICNLPVYELVNSGECMMFTCSCKHVGANKFCTEMNDI